MAPDSAVRSSAVSPDGSSPVRLTQDAAEDGPPGLVAKRAAHGLCEQTQRRVSAAPRTGEVRPNDRRNFSLFHPQLYQVAIGALSPANIAAPLRDVLMKQNNARVLLASNSRAHLAKLPITRASATFAALTRPLPPRRAMWR